MYELKIVEGETTGYLQNAYSFQCELCKHGSARHNLDFNWVQSYAVQHLMDYHGRRPQDIKVTIVPEEKEELKPKLIDPRTKDGVWVLWMYNGSPAADSVYLNVEDVVLRHESGFRIAYWPFGETLDAAVDNWSKWLEYRGD